MWIKLILLLDIKFRFEYFLLIYMKSESVGFFR